MSNALAKSSPISAKEILKAAIAELPGLKDVESLVRAKLGSESPQLTNIASYLFELGGKRMRPVLTLMTAQALGMTQPSQPLIDVAAGIELIHMATLLHDDIIDKSPMRRHHTSPFVKYGGDDTLLTGDFLLTRAFSLCARLDRFIIDRTETACIALTEGEIDEIPLFRKKHDLESSLSISRKKTAALFWLAAISAGHLGNCSPNAIELLGTFGESLGIAFQILDDILDVTSTEDLLGKKSGLDLIERKPSVVNVMWLQSGSELAKRLLIEPNTDESEFAQAALEELRGGSVVESAKQLALQFTDQALLALDQAIAMTPSAQPHYVELLKAVVAYTVERME